MIDSTNHSNCQYPLVSVIVVTYNSSKTVEEALDSVKEQTYSNIELVITDDGSKDKTVEICKNWCKQNMNRFTNVKILTTPLNTGTVKNLNRGIQASTGQWIKGLSGDDMFMTDAITEYVAYVVENKVPICSARMKMVCEDPDYDLNAIQQSQDKFFSAVCTDYDTQKKLIYGRTYMFPSPAWFFSRALYDEIGGFDERFFLMEEWPFANAVLKRGYKFCPINKELIKYRISSVSLSHQKKNIGNRLLFKDLRRYFYTIKIWQQISHFRFDLIIKDLFFYEARNAQFKNGIDCWQGRLLNHFLKS